MAIKRKKKKREKKREKRKEKKPFFLFVYELTTIPFFGGVVSKKNTKTPNAAQRASRAPKTRRRVLCLRKKHALSLRFQHRCAECRALLQSGPKT